MQFYVDPAGSDANPATENAPLASLTAARNAVRAVRAAGETGNIDVILKDGTYTLDETLVLGLKDSAPRGAVTRYRAADGAHPLISGGRVIQGWKKSELHEGNVWIAEVPWAKGDAFFHCLYDDNSLLPRARSKSFTATSEGDKRMYAGALKDRIRFAYSQDALRQWGNLEDLELYGQPTRLWLVNYLGISSVDPSTQTTELSVPATYNLDGEWFVENCIDHLDTPGEWALNSREGLLYYWPASGTPGDRITAPVLNELIRVEGTNDASLSGTNDRPVRGIVFERLRFAHADRQTWLSADKGLQHDWNMWDKANGLVRFRGAEDCAVHSCVFSDSGSDGVRLDLYCRNITIEDSILKDLGGTGILLCGYGPGRKDVNRNNIIHNNEISRVGRLFLHSPGIFIWQSGHNRITNNHIHDQSYTGMVVAGVRRRFFAPVFEKMEATNPFMRWRFLNGTREHLPTIRWDEITLASVVEWPAYEPYMHARENIIEFNEVHDCLKLLHDGNCIYLSANGDGNIVRHNVTYNHPEGAMIRTDDDSHGATVSRNLLFGTMGEQGITIKGLNSCQNNIFVNCIMTTGTAGNTVDENSELSRNVFYFAVAANASGFHRSIERVGAGLDLNLYFHENGDAKAILDRQREMSSENGAVDVHSAAGDPRFADVSTGDFSFMSDSPALRMGIEPMPMQLVGKIGTTWDPFLKRYEKDALFGVNHEKK